MWWAPGWFAVAFGLLVGGLIADMNRRKYRGYIRYPAEHPMSKAELDSLRAATPQSGLVAGVTKRRLFIYEYPHLVRRLGKIASIVTATFFGGAVVATLLGVIALIVS